MDKKISIIGIGMDGTDTITQIGLKVIEQADILIGAQRMLEPFIKLGKPTFTSFLSGQIVDYIENCSYKKVAVLMSGDCGFYSGAKKLLSALTAYNVEIICGISSPIYLCGKINMTWEDMRFVSLHGVDSNIVRNVCAHEKVFFLLGGTVSVKDICSKLCEYHLESVEVYIGENLACDDERISSGTALDFVSFETDNLCVMIVKNVNYERSILCGINDDDFIRGGVPMTKSEVRCISVSKLGIQKKSVCWDIGSGTGSVAIEMAMQCSDGRVYAVEKKPDGITLIDQNRHKFGCDNIEILHSDAEIAVQNLPPPDCVFIGGSSGQLDKIIACAYKKNPHARIVVTAVSLETLNQSVSIFEKSEVVQIAVTRTKKVGTHTMFSAENPIFIIKGLVS